MIPPMPEIVGVKLAIIAESFSGVYLVSNDYRVWRASPDCDNWSLIEPFIENHKSLVFITTRFEADKAKTVCVEVKKLVDDVFKALEVS